jgi:dienelactone hydrolase
LSFGQCAPARIVLLMALATGCGRDAATEPPPTPPVVSVACATAGGTVRTMTVGVPERGGTRILSAQLWAPEAARQTAPCPMLSVLPGGGAAIASVAWAAERLAANGYVVIVTLPSSGASTSAYHIAAVSGIDFLQSAANPYRTAVDSSRVGVAGWSLGARALTRTQAEDTRVDALVAWDNLAVSETGDAGSPACDNVPGPLRTPRVPALGQASETCLDRAADAKLTAFERWRAAGVPAMQVVFAGATHFLWSATAPDAQHEVAHAYTQAWFDRWLKEDATATPRLLGRTVPGLASRATTDALSARFRSAAALDGRACGDVRAGC